MSGQILDFYLQAPPISRTFAAAVLATSIGVHLLRAIPYTLLYFSVHRILRFPPEIWRLATSFCLTGPGLGIVLDTYWVFNYMSQLEVTSPKFSRKEDLVWYLIVVCSTIFALNHFFTGAGFYLQALILAMSYTATQDQRGVNAGFFFFTVPAQLIPYCMMLMSLLMSGPEGCILQLTGLVAAHLHDFLTRIYPEFGCGPNLLPTPAFLSRLVQNVSIQRREHDTVFRPTNQARAVGRSTGASTGSVLPDAWRSRGAGQRLGGD